MLRTGIVVSALALVLILPPASFALRMEPDLATAWDQASIVVLGTARMETPGIQAWDTSRAIYAITIEKAYKGVDSHRAIHFLDPDAFTSASLYLRDSSRYVFFLLTRKDRARSPFQGPRGNLGDTLTVLSHFNADNGRAREIEAAITIVTAYKRLKPQDRSAFLLRHLAARNRYSDWLIIREVLAARLREAIPIFRRRLSQARNEDDRLVVLGSLRILGAADVKDTLVAWLADDSFRKKYMVIDEMLKLKDTTLVPLLRRHVDATDSLTAVAARRGLLLLGQPDAKRLLLDMVGSNGSSLIRYNAIYPLSWEYSGPFTDGEKAEIEGLVHDADPSVASTAGFIVEKWKHPPDRPAGTMR